ncbi:MAG: PepSY-associated TM helix domain-containing protein [Candidatus Eisenbacteria bacterium]
MKTFRAVCRWIHREFGYFTVGLTLVYAISGLAVNHAHHWNANYKRTETVQQIEPPGTGPTPEVTQLVLERLALDEPIKNTWRESPEKLQVFLEGASIDVDLVTGQAVREGMTPRPWFYELNFMHLNTGKGPWTVIADAYAAVLILLAISGIFLVKGRKGLAGRGGILMALGILLPIVYVLLAI